MCGAVSDFMKKVYRPVMFGSHVGRAASKEVTTIRQDCVDIWLPVIGNPKYSIDM